jgi:hypothetical protein
VRRVNPAGLGNIQDPAARDAIRQIVLASAEVDLLTIAGAFNNSGTYTPTRTLNVTSPTISNVVAVLATFIDDCKRGGQNRST